MLKVYNTLTRRKEEFIPIEKGKVKMYSCGPTVYDVPHLGNFRSFVLSDNVRRYLEHLGYEVTLVMNITDIDDKTIRGSMESGVPLDEYTRRYEKAFFDGLKKLHILPAHHYPKATENVELMIKMVEDLEAKGLAYERDGSVYFPVTKFPEYGKLSGIDVSRVKVGARVDVDEYEKDNPRDFALLKRSTDAEVEKGIYYESKWGKVRPGWHIECSTLSMKHMGATLDIHTGGVDLVFPHHENEIAQSESHTGKTFVKYWIHGEHLMVGGERMGKSVGNCIALSEVLKDHTANMVRYMFVSTHYRKILDYTESLAENAKYNYERLRHAYENLLFAMATAEEGTKRDQEYLSELKDIKTRFTEAMDDDFNTPLALGVFSELAKMVNRYLLQERGRDALSAMKDLFESFSKVLGLEFPRPIELSPRQTEMIRQREAARAAGNWATADQIRSELDSEGIILEDTDWGTKWRTR